MNVGHELRTPLTSIQLASAELKEKRELDSDSAKLVSVVANASHVLLALVNDILDMNQLLSGKMILRPVTFSLHSLVEQLRVIIEPLLREKEGVDFITSVGECCLA